MPALSALELAKPPHVPPPAGVPVMPADPDIGTVTVSTKSALDLASERAQSCSVAWLDTMTLTGDKAAADALQTCKAGFAPETSGETMSAMATCPEAGNVVQTSDLAYHVIVRDFTLPAASSLRARTSGLAGTEDTVLYLVKCDGSCWSSTAVVAGDVIEADDDGNTDLDSTSPLDSKIDRANLAAGNYRVVVTSFDVGSHGIGDLEITLNGGAPSTETGLPFGGFETQVAKAEPGDSFLAGKNNNEGPMPGDGDYHDTTLSVFTSFVKECPGNCGRYFFNDDARATSNGTAQMRILLSKIKYTEATFRNGRAVVGAYGTFIDSSRYQINARFLHYRRHTDEGGVWTCAEQKDQDRDGLSQEIETAVGSCDTTADAPSGGVVVANKNCLGFGQFVNAQVNAELDPDPCPVTPASTGNGGECWNTMDSDNDGVRDDWEVFAGGRSCTETPTGPLYGNLGTCSDLDLHDTGTGCLVGSFCPLLTVSALQQPHPGAYDIFVQQNYVKCTGSQCAADYAGGPQHARSNLGQVFHLAYPWTTDPETCWDGTTGACPNADRDLRYRVRLHYYLGDDAIADTVHAWPRVGSEMAMFGDFRTYNSFFNRRFGTGSLAGRRYLNVFRFSLALLGGAGQAPGHARHHVWTNANATTTPQVIMVQFSHELGHNLGLEHPHEFRPAALAEPDGAQVPAGKCDKQGLPCTGNCRCFANCATGPEPNNPAVPSVMNYGYTAGMPEKNAASPTGIGACQSTCSWKFSRFSKGLNNFVLEGSLLERTNTHWTWMKYAQETACYTETGINGSCSPFGRYPVEGNCIPGTPGHICKPSCDIWGCYFDYNRDQSYATSAVSWDVSRGDFDFVSGSCVLDSLSDVDEWRRIIGRGRLGLSFLKDDDYVSYAAPFNNGTATDLAEWGYPILVDATFDLATYERNMCEDASACSTGQSCKKDTCTTPTQVADCGTDSCNGGVCSCTLDADCPLSGWCDKPAGKCGMNRGTCGCFADEHCVAVADESKCNAVAGHCQNIRSAEIDPSPPNDMTQLRPRESVKFDGTNSGDDIVLQCTANGGPCIGMDSRNSFEFGLDFRWDGFSAGNPIQVLVKIDIFQLVIHDIGNGPQLRATVTGFEWAVLIAPAPIQAHRWYRVRWALSAFDVDYWLQVVPWDLRQGWFPAAVPASHCRRRSLGVNLGSPGDVRIGSSSTTGVTDFHGRIDNFGIFNRELAAPAGCVVQP